MKPLGSNFWVGPEGTLPDYFPGETKRGLALDWVCPEHPSHESDNSASPPRGTYSHGTWAAVQHEVLLGPASCECPVYSCQPYVRTFRGMSEAQLVDLYSSLTTGEVWRG